jgi:hypothetical protein
VSDTTRDRRTPTQRISDTVAILRNSLADAIVRKDLYERAHGIGNSEAEYARGRASALRAGLYHLGAGSFDEIDAVAELAWPDAMVDQVQVLLRCSAEATDPAAAARFQNRADIGTEMLGDRRATL